MAPNYFPQYLELLRNHPKGLKISEASDLLKGPPHNVPVSHDTINRYNRKLLKMKLIVQTDERGRYKLVAGSTTPALQTAMMEDDSVPVVVKNSRLVLDALFQLRKGNTDDVRGVIGELPSRGINFAFTFLLKNGYIRLFEKIGNAKGVYEPTERGREFHLTGVVDGKTELAETVPPAVIVKQNQPSTEEDMNKIEVKLASGAVVTLPANTPPSYILALVGDKRGKQTSTSKPR